MVAGDGVLDVGDGLLQFLLLIISCVLEREGDVHDGKGHLLESAVSVERSFDGKETTEADTVLIESKTDEMFVGLEGLSNGNGASVAHQVSRDVERLEGVVGADAIEEDADV